MLTCRELTEVVTDYLEGRLSAWEWLRFQFHLGACRPCRAYLRRVRATVRALGRLPDEPVPQEVKEELLARFRRPRPAAHADAWTPVVKATCGDRKDTCGDRARWRGWAVALAAILAAVVASLLLGGESGPILGAAGHCLLIELGAAGLFLAAAAGVVARGRVRLAAGELAALGAGGALLAFLSMAPACPNPLVTAHLLVVHAGGVLLAALAGALAFRVPPFRGALT